MQEAAVLRLVAYSKVDDNFFANARFLNLKETVDDGRAAETSLRKMVKDERPEWRLRETGHRHEQLQTEPVCSFERFLRPIPQASNDQNKPLA